MKLLDICKSLKALILTLSNDVSEVSGPLLSQLLEYRMLTFFHFLYEHLSQLSKFFQKKSLHFSDIEIIINTIINKLRFEYLPDNNGNIKFGFHLRKFFNNLRFINETRVDFGEFQLNYSYNDHQELLIDIQTYTRSLIGCIEERFPNKPLITARKFLIQKNGHLI